MIKTRRNEHTYSNAGICEQTPMRSTTELLDRTPYGSSGPPRAAGVAHVLQSLSQ